MILNCVRLLIPLELLLDSISIYFLSSLFFFIVMCVMRLIWTLSLVGFQGLTILNYFINLIKNHEGKKQELESSSTMRKQSL